MVLVTNHIQSSHVAFPSRPSWNRGVKLKQRMTMFQTVSRTHRRVTLKRAFSLRIGSPQFHDARGKPLKISCFKGNVQNDEAGNAPSNSTKFPKNRLGTSYVCQDGDETLTDSSKLQEAAVSVAASTANNIESRSQAMHRLFRKWLTILHTQSPNQVRDEIIEEPPQGELVRAETANQAEERGEILKVVLCYFLGLDATIKIPLLIFIPLFLAVNMVYGADVSRELTPLWIIGPLVVALYVKMFQAILALYVFSFKLTVMIFKNLPTYYSLAYKYVADGTLKKEIRARLWQPIVDMRNLDYREFSVKKQKQLEEWMMEKYLDFVESIWPYYCRTIRFLKRANLI
ncbi:hypothetical protein Ancab_034240 [Ancistrocladus abbreviatus]